jgi:uncharacterized membrane protein YhaH (DUF805 family)
MSFSGAISSCLAQYAGFQGRATRSEYWYWFLLVFVISLIGDVFDHSHTIIGHLIGALFSLVELGLVLPGIAVSVRRLHDLDKSGFWLFLGLLPVIGGLILLVWFCMPGTRGPNQFGGGTRMGGMGPMPMPVGFN